MTSIETLIKLGKEPYNGVYDVLRDIVEQQMDNLLKGSA